MSVKVERELRFRLETIKRLTDLEHANRIDITSAMNSIRALVADQLPEPEQLPEDASADNEYSVKLEGDSV